MPSRGGLRLSVFAMTCAVGLATASSASAGDVVLWACHGPTGEPLGAAPFGGAPEYGGGCAVSGTDGVRSQSFGLIVRPDLVLEQVMVERGTSGLGSEGGANRYSGTYRGVEFDGSSTDVSGAVTRPIAPAGDFDGGFVKFSASGVGTSVSVQRVGLTVADTKAPSGAVSLANHMDGSRKIGVTANDAGVGLDRAELYVDGALVGTGKFPSTNCKDIVPGGMIDLPIANDCPAHGDTTIDFDTNQVADGPHTLVVRAYDAAGNAADLVSGYATEILNHPNLGSNSADLSIGSGNAPQQNGSGSGSGGSGGVAGASATSCGSPRLSMELSQKPLKISKGVPVLKYGKRYRFRGRLTCVVDGKRRSAAVKTPIELLNTIGKKTYRKTGAAVRSKGAITLVLAYKSSRTLVFRYTNADGKRTQVKLKIKVTKKSR
jgi:hypothetical protein